ncbi:MAG: cyclic nucleotide-binding domain-containing protein [Desulfobacterales bacterium]|nr:cyclic nucleotide-binding domain-containing protein [Desulfobacterales bacterium]
MPDRKSTPLMTFIEETAPPPKTVKGLTLQLIPAGEDIFTEGDHGDDAFVLKSGLVEISIMDSDKKLVLTRLEEQSVFGEMALILGDHQRTATAKAVEDCSVIRIPKKIFNAYMKSSPSVISKCLIAIATRLDELTDKATLALPDLFEGTARVLHLMQVHQQNNLLYDDTVETMARLMSRTKSEVVETVEMMKAMNLVKISQSRRDHKRIFLIGRKDFLDKALKIKSVLDQYKEPGTNLKVSLPPGAANID